MSESNGYVWLWRQATDSEVWVHEGMWKLWTLCLMLANWKPKHEGGLDLKRGQFITGRYHLHAAYHRGNRKWRTAKPCAKTLLRWLRTLENMGNLSLNVSTLGTVVTICNWKRYQPELDENVHESVQRVSSECPSDVQPVSTPNKGKKGKKVKKKKAADKESSAYRDFTDYFSTEWKRLQEEHLDYPWAKGKDGVAAAAVWAACKEDLSRAKRVVDAYFATRDKFYVGHPLALMNMNLPKFMAKASSGSDTYDDPSEKEARQRQEARLKREAAT